MHPCSLWTQNKQEIGVFRKGAQLSASGDKLGWQSWSQPASTWATRHWQNYWICDFTQQATLIRKWYLTFNALVTNVFENLKCKTTPPPYHQKLQWFTSPYFPRFTPNSSWYAELRQVTCQWRNLKYGKWFRFLSRRHLRQGREWHSFVLYLQFNH